MNWWMEGEELWNSKSAKICIKMEEINALLFFFFSVKVKQSCYKVAEQAAGL